MLLKSSLIALGAIGVAAFVVLFLMRGRGGESVNVAVFDHITVGDQRIAIHAHGEPDAVILHDGSLLIGDAMQPINSVQKAQLKTYYDSTLALRKAAIGAGREGIATAQTAASSVARGLASGNPGNIGDEVNKQAAKVDVHAQDIDQRLAEMRRLQGEIVAGTPAFAPYAFME